MVLKLMKSQVSMLGNLVEVDIDQMLKMMSNYLQHHIILEGHLTPSSSLHIPCIYPSQFHNNELGINELHDDSVVALKLVQRKTNIQKPLSTRPPPTSEMCEKMYKQLVRDIAIMLNFRSKSPAFTPMVQDHL